jgi:hypothetical protein
MSVGHAFGRASSLFIGWPLWQLFAKMIVYKKYNPPTAV